MIKNIHTYRVKSQLAQWSIDCCIVLPDGCRIACNGGAGIQPTLTLKDWATLGHLAHGDIGVIASDWVEGKLQFEGGMRELMQLAAQIVPEDIDLRSRAESMVQMGMLQHWVGKLTHSKAQSMRDVQSHYDVTDEFFSIWLDNLKVYSCGYFEHDQATLQEAQVSKLDLICRKLDLSSSDRFLDIGMGWGALLFWAAEKYGVQAHGITLSKHQYEHVQRQIDRRRLGDRVKVRLLDYRDLSESDPFDKIASVGMFEHVGQANMLSYFDKIHGLLKPGGIVMNHGITAGGVDYRQLGLGIGDFIERYIFPGGELVHLSEVSRCMTLAHLELVDAECLRPHYAKTLWAWSDNLEDRLYEAHTVLQRAHGLNAQTILRAYRLYLAGCAMGFEQGWTSIYQVLAVRSGSKPRYPYRRDYMYST